jgi:hypothetical protein
VRHSGNGVSDIILNIAMGGIMLTVYVEVKKPGGKLRESQIEFSKRIENMGGTYISVSSLCEIQESIPGIIERIETSVLIAKIPW